MNRFWDIQSYGFFFLPFVSCWVYVALLFLFGVWARIHKWQRSMWTGLLLVYVIGHWYKFRQILNKKSNSSIQNIFFLTFFL